MSAAYDWVSGQQVRENDLPPEIGPDEMLDLGHRQLTKRQKVTFGYRFLNRARGLQKKSKPGRGGHLPLRLVKTRAGADCLIDRRLGLAVSVRALPYRFAVEPQALDLFHEMIALWADRITLWCCHLASLSICTS